jgi:addiction module RelE/StbE family toxin
MSIKFQKNFEKQYKKLSTKTKEKIKERIIIFENDQFNPMINNHALQGKYTGYRSINITGDFRIIYKLLDERTVLFVEIGTHSKLYF